MRVLFVHGMGRSTISGWPMLRHLRFAGLQTDSFGYSSCLQSFGDICLRLVSRISELPQHEEYVLVGHSLGGVFIRAALNELPPNVKPPRHIFLLGSPVRPARLAQRLQNNILFKAFTRDSGRFLACERQMSGLAVPKVPVTSIVGVTGFTGKMGPFGTETNDGLVALSEASAEWLTDQVRLPVIHTLLPASKQVASVILERIRAMHCSAAVTE